MAVNNLMDKIMAVNNLMDKKNVGGPSKTKQGALPHFFK